MTTSDRPAQGIGAPLQRKEDDRLMRGRGEYVANLRLVGMRDVAFVRSPIDRRASFEKAGGQWRLRSFVIGD